MLINLAVSCLEYFKIPYSLARWGNFYVKWLLSVHVLTFARQSIILG